MLKMDSIDEEIRQKQKGGKELTPIMRDYLIYKKQMETDIRLVNYIRGAMFIIGLAVIGFLIGQLLLKLF